MSVTAGVPAPAPPVTMPYVWAVVFLFMFGVILVGVVLWLRPAYDPLVVIVSVMGFVATSSTGVAAFMKAQETHLTVNSQLAAWKDEFYKMAHAEGMLAGGAGEQARVAEQRRILALVPAALVPPGSVPVPIPVVLAGPDPLPVHDDGKGKP